MWSGIPLSLRMFQSVVIHPFKGFSVVNKAEAVKCCHCLGGAHIWTPHTNLDQARPRDNRVQCYKWSQLLNSHYLQNVGKTA